MNTQTCRPRSRRKNGFFMPAVENIFNEVMNTPFKEFQREASTAPSTKPKANVIQTENDYRLEMALPGYTKEDVKISLDKNVLTVSSDKVFGEDKTYRLREFQYGEFERRFSLSDKMDKGSISASFDNGLLSITIDKIKPAPPKTINIS